MSKSNDHKESGFQETNPRLRVTVAPACSQPSALAGSSPRHRFLLGPPPQLFIPLALLRSSVAAGPRPSLQSCSPLLPARVSVWTVFPFQRRRHHRRAGNEGLQMADDDHMPAALPQTCGSVPAVRDTRVTFLLSRQKVFRLPNCKCHHVTEFSTEPETGVLYQ